MTYFYLLNVQCDIHNFACMSHIYSYVVQYIVFVLALMQGGGEFFFLASETRWQFLV